MYKSFSFLLIPFVVIIIGIIWYDPFIKKVSGDSTGSVALSDLTFYLILITGVILIIIALTHWWTGYFYGKYAKRIRGILDEIIE